MALSSTIFASFGASWQSLSAPSLLKISVTVPCEDLQERGEYWLSKALRRQLRLLFPELGVVTLPLARGLLSLEALRQWSRMLIFSWSTRSKL